MANLFVCDICSSPEKKPAMGSVLGSGGHCATLTVASIVGETAFVREMCRSCTDMVKRHVSDSLHLVKPVGG